MQVLRKISFTAAVAKKALNYTTYNFAKDIPASV